MGFIIPNLKMEPLYHLKFSFNRSRTLAIALFNVQELTLLGLIIAQEYSGFYSSLLEVLMLGDWLTYYFFAGMLLSNVGVSVCLLLTVVLRVEMLGCLLPVLSAFIKLFPYLLSVLAFNLCFLAIFNNSAVMVRLAATLNLPFLLAYLLLHQYINYSLKFREVDFCNRKVGSLAETLLVPTALLLLQVLGPFYASICVSLRAAYELLILFSHCEYPLPQQLKAFYGLFTFYFSFLMFLSNFDIVISKSTFKAPHVTLLVLLGGALASWMLSRQLVTLIWRRMFASTRGSVEQSEGDIYGND